LQLKRSRLNTIYHWQYTKAQVLRGYQPRAVVRKQEDLLFLSVAQKQKQIGNPLVEMVDFQKLIVLGQEELKVRPQLRLLFFLPSTFDLAREITTSRSHVFVHIHLLVFYEVKNVLVQNVLQVSYNLLNFIVG
jgi:hypothetical protein